MASATLKRLALALAAAFVVSCPILAASDQSIPGASATSPASTPAPSSSASQAGTATPATGTTAPVSFAAFPLKQVLVLMYHQVTNTPDSVNLGAGHYGPAVSPKDFEADLVYLRACGFRPVDPKRALRYLDGRADASSLPDHPYVITFDDGFVSAWTNATPILRRQNARAMMFIEGKRTDLTPGRLSSAQIRAMAKSGVWEIESHGYTGHWALQIGPKPSDLSAYWYANLAWLPAAKRLETPPEFEARLLADFQRSRQTLAALSGIQATTFAYPSGEYGQDVPLPSGADPDVFAGEQGHSNAAGLTPLIQAALHRAGFNDAFAVVVPGTESGASPADAPYLFPRIGESPRKHDPGVLMLTGGQLRLPAISPDYHWVDARSILAVAGSVWVAGNAAPYLYRMDALTGRIEEVVDVKPLQAGREGQPVLATGLVMEPDGRFLAYQQKGWWDGGQPRLVSFRVENHAVVDVKTTVLDEDSAWFVGVTLAQGRLIGMTEDGEFYQLDGLSARQLPFSLPNDPPGWKRDDLGRFVGLTYAHGLLYIVDRKDAKLLGVDPASGAIKEASDLPHGADIRAVGGDDHYLWLVDYARERRSLIRRRSTQGAST